MTFLIGVIVLILFIVFCYFFIKRKIRNYLGCDISEILESARIEDEDVPKSLSSMDSIYLEQIKKDFPDLNINELKRESEKVIVDSYLAIDKNDTSKINGVIKSFVLKKINEYPKVVKHNNFKIHNTVISKYEKNNGVATIYFSSSFQYNLVTEGSDKKIQDRAKTEFIYVIDSDLVPVSQKNLGINCPNCGSPIKTLGDKTCSYCGTNVLNIVKKVWICNNIVSY